MRYRDKDMFQAYSHYKFETVHISREQNLAISNTLDCYMSGTLSCGTNKLILQIMQVCKKTILKHYLKVYENELNKKIKTTRRKMYYTLD